MLFMLILLPVKTILLGKYNGFRFFIFNAAWVDHPAITQPADKQSSLKLIKNYSVCKTENLCTHTYRALLLCEVYRVISLLNPSSRIGC